jgi:hypothetical protein
MRKYISTYSNFLFEQGVPFADPNAAPATATKKEEPIHFIFLDDTDGLRKKKYPDGTSAVDYPAYSVSSAEIEEWVKKNIISTNKNNLTDPVLDIRRKNIVEIVKGNKVNIADDDIPFIEKLKNAVSTDIFGRREPDSTIIFTSDGRPTTTDIQVTFIKYDK